MEEKYGISTKRFMYAELKEKFDTFPSFVVTNYKGLSTLEIEELRKALQKSSSRYFVVKNSIAKRVFKECNLSGLDQLLKGEVGIGFFGNFIEASKTFVEFSKGHSALKLTGAVIDGKIENVDRVKHLATLPPREVLLAMVLSYMKGPITNFIGILQNLLRNFVIAIHEIKKKKEGGE